MERKTLTTQSESNKRIDVVYGTRPEAIKLSQLIRSLREKNTISLGAVSTGQHRDLLNDTASHISFKADYDLNVFSERQSLSNLAASILTNFHEHLLRRNTDLVIVQGDTTTAFAAGLAAFHLKVPIVHVEAGLRSKDQFSPFPEEANRRMLSAIVSLHLAPTDSAKTNLILEGVNEDSIKVVGNTVIDALLAEAKPLTPYDDKRIEHAIDSGRKITLVTLHRRENVGSRIESVVEAIYRISEIFQEDIIILPLHPNPDIREQIIPTLTDTPNVILCDPLPYNHFSTLLRRTHLILTDSGGLQEEAPALGVPVLVLRNNTERVESIASGAARLVGTNTEDIVRNVVELKTSTAAYESMAAKRLPYGDGNASSRAVQHILDYMENIVS